MHEYENIDGRFVMISEEVESLAFLGFLCFHYLWVLVIVSEGLIDFSVS